MNTNLLLGGIIVILALLGWGGFEHGRYARTKLQLETVESMNAQLLDENKRKEVENEERIKIALTERESLTRQLHDNQVRLSDLRNSITTQRPGGACTESATVDTALSQFLADVEGFITEGDQAVINVKAWSDSWPQ